MIESCCARNVLQAHGGGSGSPQQWTETHIAIPGSKGRMERITTANKKMEQPKAKRKAEKNANTNNKRHGEN